MSQPPYGQPYDAPHPGYPMPSGVPATNVGWVIAGFLLFWPTGIAALFAFQKAERALGAGDYQVAALEGARAKRFGVISLCVLGGLTVLYVLLWILIAALALGGASSYHY